MNNSMPLCPQCGQYHAITTAGVYPPYGTSNSGSWELTDTEKMVEILARKDERRRVIEELRVYVQHRRGCSITYPTSKGDFTGACTCGLTALLGEPVIAEDKKGEEHGKE